MARCLVSFASGLSVPPRRILNHSDSMYGALVAGVLVSVGVEGVKEGGQGGPLLALVIMFPAVSDGRYM